MGKATIVSGGTGGLYSVRLEYSGMDGQIAAIEARRAALEAELPTLRNGVAMAWDEAQMAKATMQALLDQYLAALAEGRDPSLIGQPEVAGPGPSEDDKREVLRLVNDIRAAEGLEPLAWNDSLAGAAEAFAKDRASVGEGGHTGSDGSQPYERMQAGGYDGTNFGENVAVGQKTPAEVVKAWMDSPPHRKNILDPGFKELGVGGGSGKGGNYWTQNFGARA
jgi:uncharacterized protein YkwD